MLRFTSMLGVSVYVTILTPAGWAQPSEKVGDAYDITREARTSTTRGGQSSGMTFDRDTIAERVVAVRADGLELMYDLPAGASADDRARSWQFPARVLRSIDGNAKLLNGAELETRLDRWLKSGNLPRTACGHWIFTLNAFKIECDPQSVLATVAAFDLRPADLRDGALYREAGALDAAPLMKTASTRGGARYSVTLRADPDKVRHDRAESDVVIGEITRKPITLDAALRARSAEQITGSITITFDADAAGAVILRTKTIKLRIKRSDGAIEESTATETLHRNSASTKRTAVSADGI